MTCLPYVLLGFYWWFNVRQIISANIFFSFKEFVHSHSPQDLVDVEEFDKMLEEVRDDMEKKEREKKRKEEDRKKRDKKDKDSTAETKDSETPKPSDDDPPGVEKDDRTRPPVSVQLIFWQSFE